MVAKISSLFRDLVKSPQSFWHTYSYIYRRLDPLGGWILILSVASLCGSVYSLSQEVITSLVLLVFAIAGIGFKLWQIAWKHRRSDLRISDNRDLLASLASVKPALIEEANGFRVVADPEIKDSTITYSPELNAALQNNERDYQIEIDNAQMKNVTDALRNVNGKLIPILLWHYTKFSKDNKVFINESKIGIASTLSSNHNQKSLRIFKGDYFTSFLTNELCTKKIDEAKSGKVFSFYDPSENFPLTHLSDGPRIKELHDYYFGNHIGVSTIGISSDRYLCLWQQNPKAIVSVGKRAPTGSGSCDWKDLAADGSLKKSVLEGMERELVEESIVKRGLHLDRSAIARTMLLGYFRILCRGAKPEFVGLSVLSKNRIDLSPNPDEVEDPTAAGIVIQYPVPTLDELKSRVQQLLLKKEERRTLSVSLWGGLIALRDALDAKPDMIRTFVGYD